MRIIKTKDYNDMSRKAANIISAQVILKPDCVLGLATGSTPVGTYKQLIDWYNKGDLDFSEVTSVNLDEYKGLDKDNDQSYWYFMHTNFFDHININSENVNLPNGMEPDSDKECARYDDIIRSVGGVDLQLLGLGHNGHIGFNEPAEEFKKGTHCVDLTQSTIEANASRAALTFYYICLKPLSVVVVNHGHFLAGNEVGSVHEVFVDSYAAHVVKVGFGDGCTVYL